jgi:outer membrane protein assembly factor BamB
MKVIELCNRPVTTCLLLCALLMPLSLRPQAASLTFAPGDVFVSLERGPVLWRNPDGTPRSVLVPTMAGTGEGMAFDASGNLYVTRWCIDPGCPDTGNAVEMFNVFGLSNGKVGPTFECHPHTIVIEPDDTTYVGLAGCRKTLLKFVPGAASPIEYTLAEDTYGVFWMDLAADGCTMFYTSVSRNVKRFDVCTNVQLPDFNAAPLPGSVAHDLRVLPDGGVLVANGHLVVRLDSFGLVAQTYEVAGEETLWAGVELVGDGTFWAGNYRTSNVYKFNLDGTRLASFNAATPPETVVAIRVLKSAVVTPSTLTPPSRVMK